MPDFLLELLSEEIPARMQARAAEDLRRMVLAGLTKADLSHGGASAFVTPRRLALRVEGLPTQQPDLREERKGPRVGANEAAIQGFLRAARLPDVAAAEIRDTEKGRFYFAVTEKPGRPTADVLAEIVAEVIASFPWPKSMRWGAGRLRWVRPLQNILGLLDDREIPLRIAVGDGDLGALAANRYTEGHRFMAGGRFAVSGYLDYRAKLAAGCVVLDVEQRKARIKTAADALAAAEGLVVRHDAGLLDEVAGLVEWPVALIGRIDPHFMDVPAEVLITSMRTHQKYFSLLGADGHLAPRFVVIANTETPDGGAAVVAGNERVLRARLSDARFFWEQDRKAPLDSRVAKLSERVFHAQLGSDLERTGRLQALARQLAPACGADPDLAARAARLCKADLTTGMVGEFPELQGVMGRYYARHDGEAHEVADAIAEHYAPKGPSDRCPSAPVSVAVALADKIDTLVGFFGVGLKPTGSGDPFALRRAALGLIRLIVENHVRLNLRPVLVGSGRMYAGILFAGGREGAAADVLDFVADRLKVHLREKGVRHDLIAAAFAGGEEDDLVRLLARVAALDEFLKSDDGANLLVAFRRASNIVRIEEAKDGASHDGAVDPALLAEPAERALHAALGAAQSAIRDGLDDERFDDAMRSLARLRPPVDQFFETVTVNCDDAQARANRLRLLSQIRASLAGVADFGAIEG